MHTEQLAFPGKTFLLGEYSVLQGGAAIIACTEPYFELKVSKDYQGKHPFHSQSPAGKFIADHSEIFQSFTLEWFSPYADGGFGGSTAEFLACFKLYYQQINRPFSQETLYETYLKYAYHNQGIRPSGFDLIAQTQQTGLVHVQSRAETPILLQWPFNDLNLVLLKTNDKLPTHEHLQALNSLPDCSDLIDLTEQGLKALQQANKESWLTVINNYGRKLSELGLTLKATETLILELKTYTPCLAAKGCGALGADVIVAVIPKEEITTLNSWCQSHQLIISVVI